MVGREVVVGWVLTTLGAILGGVIGYYGFAWIYRQGFYALILPGALVGIGCGLMARYPSNGRGVACGLAGLGLGLFTEWKFFPFVENASFPFFLTHVHWLKPITLLMIGVGTACAYWFGKDARYSGRIRRTYPFD